MAAIFSGERIVKFPTNYLSVAAQVHSNHRWFDYTAIRDGNSKITCLVFKQWYIITFRHDLLL